MEGQHFAAGPWFTVQKSGDDWKELDTVWLSNGSEHVQVKVEIRMALEEMEEDATDAR